MNNPCPFSVQHAVKTGGTPAIELRQLSKMFPRGRAPALDGIDLTVRQGGFFGILGPNGAGKTTLMSVLGGLLKPSSGSVRINGQDLAEHRVAIKRVLGMVPQEPAIYPTLTARENLEYFGRMQGLSGGHLLSRVAACLDLAEISEEADQRVEHFSGGFKRRLNLVIGLIHEPRILILDEPTVAIDPHSRALIHHRLRELHAAGISILISTHYMEEAESLCQEIAIMHRGRILVQGPVGDLLAMQRNKTIQMQLASDPPDELALKLQHITGLENAFVSGRCITVTAERPDEVIGPLVQAVHDYGLAVYSMNFGASSLEQVFLSLTENPDPAK